MARVICPRCATRVDVVPGARPVCPSCGFGGAPSHAAPTPPQASRVAPATGPKWSPGSPSPVAPPAPPRSLGRRLLPLWITLGVLGALIVFVVVAAVVFVLVQNLGDDGPDCGSGEAYHHRGLGFGFCPHEEWQVDDSFGAGVVVAALSPPSGESDVFRENVNVVVAAAGDLDLEETADEGRESLMTFLTDVEIVDERSSVLGGSEAWTFQYRFRQGQLDLEGWQTLTLHDGRAYFWTFTTQQGEATAETIDAEQAMRRSFAFD